MEANDISIRPAKRQATIGDVWIPSPFSDQRSRPVIVLRAPPTSTAIWPGDFVEVNLPDDAPPDCVVLSSHVLMLRVYES